MITMSTIGKNECLRKLKTGIGRSTLEWREGNQLVKLTATSSSDDALAWLRKVAERM